MSGSNDAVVMPLPARTDTASYLEAAALAGEEAAIQALDALHNVWRFRQANGMEPDAPRFEESHDAVQAGLRTMRAVLREARENTRDRAAADRALSLRTARPTVPPTVTWGRGSRP